MGRTLRTTALGILLLFILPGWSATPRGGKPYIRITAPQNGARIRGTSVTVHVAVSNFTLVPPVYLNPPALPGNQGHIHYYFDSLSNFVATRDAGTALSHTFTNLTPGRHTFIVYLATSQHAKFPGTVPAQVHVTLVPEAPVARVIKPSIAIMGVQSKV